MKKLILSLIIAAMFVGTAMPLAGAVSPAETAIVAQADNEVQPRAEVTEWYYRVYEGRYQKRLWSITYGYWLTDWIYC